MKRHTVAGFIGIFLVSLSVWQIWSAGKGLDILQVQRDAVPVTIVIPKARPRDEMPVVLLGHGFAGSGVFMRAFAYPLAYAGYAAVLWDFDGHGRNPNPLSSSASGGDLVQNAEAALAAALSLGIGDPSRVAILGHSMGSGVAMTFGQRYPHTAATIAVSPVGTQVTPELPRNLLLLAGENEPAFQRNAQLRLVEAGGSGGSFQAGTARQMQVIPMVEHISIVFSPLTHRAAVEWLDAVFGVQPSAAAYTDRRVIWYGLGVLGALLAAVGFIPPSQTRSDKTPTTRRSLLSLLVGALGATLLLWGLDLVGFSLARSFGLVVGGYLLVWFALAGILALLILDQWRDWLVWPGWKSLGSGFLSASVLWLGMGLLGSEIWLPWLLIPSRLVLWPLAVLLILPWFLAVGRASRNGPGWAGPGWWLVQSVFILASLLLAVRLSSGLSFLMLILPVFPVLLGAHALAAGRQRDPWAFGVSAALFTSWAVLAVFPLQ